MEDARSRSGGSSEQSADADVLGDRSRRGAPFADRLGDYAEIFADHAGSISIPFLDLPPALDGFDAAAPVRTRGAGFDYSDVFGGVDSGESAALHDELFAAPKLEETCSSKGRTREEATCSQHMTREPKVTPEQSHGGRMTCQEGDRSSPNSTPSDICSTQFNVSYNKSSQGSKEGAMSGKTHITQLHAIPAFSFVVDTDTPFQTIGGDGPRNMLNEGVDNRKDQNKVLSASSGNISKSSENYLRADQKNTNRYPVSDNGHANASHHSHSFSHSISNGNVPPSDTVFFTASEFSLQTQPLRVPPPSRPSPRLYDKQELSKQRLSSSSKFGLDEVSFLKSIPKEKDFHVRQEVVKDNSPSFTDVQVDISSAAAASVAAVKEAMELAQAKLKRAKQLMERKHGILRNSRKLGYLESMKYKEQKLCQASPRREDFDEMLVASERRQEVTSTAKLTPCDEKKEKVKFTEEEGKARQVNDLKSSELLNRSAGNYNELVSSENHILIEEVSERKDFTRKTKIITMIGEIKQNESTNDTLACQTESNRNLQKDKAAPVVCVHEDNSNLEAHVSHTEEVEKPGEVHKLHIQEEVTKAPCAGEETLSSARSEKKMEPSYYCKLHYTHVDKEENSKLKSALGKSGAAKPQDQNYSKEIDITNIAPVPGKGEDKFNMASVTVVQEEMDIEVPYVSCVSKGEGRVAASKCTDSEKTRREGKQCDAENVNRSEGMMVVHEQERREELNMKQQTCLSAENEIRFKEDKEADELEEVLKKWKTSGRTTTLEDQEKLIKATKAAFWLNYDGNNPKETQLELQQRDKKKDATPEPYNLENFEGQNKYERGFQVCGNEGIIEIQVEPHFMDKIFSINTIPIICNRPLHMALNAQPSNLSENEGNLSYSSLIATDRLPVASQKIILDTKKTEQKEKELMEKKGVQIKKPSRNLKEKEKERIQEQEEEKTRLLREAIEREEKLVEEERTRLWEETKDRVTKLEEEKKQGRLLEEANERERKLKEEKERARLSEEAKEIEWQMEEEELAKLLEKGKDSIMKEEEEQAKLFKEAIMREMKVEMARVRSLEEAKERDRKEEEERARLLEEAKKRERKLEEEERARLLEEANEWERGREKDRLAEERAIHEAHERAFTEARERAERMAVERITSEARQRALKEAQEKAKKTSCDALDKSLTEKASRDARLRAERAAVERATAEARERAIERALAVKVAADAREHAERYNATSRDTTRKENVTEECSNTRDKDGPLDAQFQSTSSLNSYQANSDSNYQQSSESALRCKARLERHQRIAERAAKALAEKNMRDVLAQREQAEKNRLAEYLDGDIKRWSNGKEGNLRALLSTLQYILGPESGWQPIQLTDVITSSAVKKAYRRATLCVHPDKLQQRGASIQQKYICEKVFDLLKEAWNRFNSEER
nr:PREDICTED: auxilin-like protein 1 isoform X2 [Musa acuminata subsp. malaccensis]